MFESTYRDEAPTREELAALDGPVIVEFGNNWCGHCQRASPTIERALAQYPGVAHRRIADARSVRLGRFFRVKLWPTLIFLRDGSELARVVRPTREEEILAGLRAIVS